jgi:hypothetical protein
MITVQYVLVPGICLLAATIFFCALIAIHAYDRLVLVQRTKFEQVWKQDGEPRPAYLRGGLMWNNSLRSGLASHKCSFAWAWSTPDWIRQDPTAFRYHRRLRLSTLVSTAALVIPAAGLLVSHWPC